MKKPLLNFIFILGLYASDASANAWVSRASIPTIGRQRAVGFSVGHMGYIGLGRNAAAGTLFGDFWKYDPTNNTWTQVANFGGSARFASASFVINDTAYVGLGADSYVSSYNFRKDFWKYDAGNNTWIQVADFGGTARYAAATFSINTNGYVGTGFDQVTPFYQDFWEYNSLTDSWSQKSDFPGGAIETGTGFAIGSYGYIGGGWNNSTSSDFYKYDPSSDTWSQIADLPTTLTNSTAFVLSNLAYLGTGSASYPAINLTNQWWTYDPQTNSWSTFASMSSIGRYNAVSFAIDGRGYAGTGGITDWSHETNDFWTWEGIGTNDLENVQFPVNIYPNPTSGIFIVEADVKGEVSIRIFNSISQVVYEEVVNNYETNNRISLNLRNFSKGLYFIKMQTKNAFSIKKIILE